MRSTLSILFCLVLLSGCAGSWPNPLQRMFLSESEQTLSAAIDAYDEGHFSTASTLIHRSLKEGLPTAGQVRARKYLAFIHCISGREAECRAEFTRALALDPSMELSAAEIGHPMWGRVFRSAKAARAK